MGKIKKIEILKKDLYIRSGIEYLCKITAEIKNKEDLKEIEFNQVFMTILPEVGMDIKIAKNSKGEYCFVNYKSVNIFMWAFVVVFFVTALFTIAIYYFFNKI